MRRNFCYLLAVIATMMFTQANAQQTAKVTSNGIGYLEYLPQGYNNNTNDYPVVISLHGIKERGTTSTDPAVIKKSVLTVANVGLPKYVKYGQQYPFILISPQLKSSYGTWPADYVMQVVNHVKRTLRIDERRIYLTGLSLGGFGVWKTAGAYPEVFAAIAPICSGGNALSQACNIAEENLPIWTFHGDKDAVVTCQVSIKMVNAVNGCTPKPSPLAKITIYPGMGHNVWDKAYKESSVLNWLLTFRNGTTATTPSEPAPSNQLPIVSAGSDKTITLPTNTVALQGSASDPDGSIVSYAWAKLSGGSASLSGTTSSKLSVSGLASGSYTFRLTVKDNKGASKSDDVAVVVKSASTSTTAPIANAGTDKTITTRSTYLSGSATAASGRTIRYYKWYKVSGPGNSMNYVSTPKLYVYNMNEGTYTFKLTVTDNLGATGSDLVTVRVTSGTAQVIDSKPANQLLADPHGAPAVKRATASLHVLQSRYRRSMFGQQNFISEAIQERRRFNAG